MKDIGIKFKDKRESIGIKEEEAAKDLEITIPQLENLEDGNVNAFKDIFFLKELIKKYTKYLNLDEEEIMNSFNEFVFDFTSKIPVEEIEEKIKEIEKQNEKEQKTRISSPYTIKRKRNMKIRSLYLYFGITILLVCITLIILNILFRNKRELNNYYVERECYYEFAE